MRTATTALVLCSLVACGRKEAGKSGASNTASVTAASATPTKGSTEELTIGKPAPEIEATAHDGTPISIAGSRGKYVVLYFYPKDETPGCTKEACSFRDAWKELEAKGVVLVGISTDSTESHKKFALHHNLPFHLVSDPDGTIAKAYGVPMNAGFLARQTFVIGPDGNLKKVYRSVDVTKHAAEVLADVKS